MRMNSWLDHLAWVQSSTRMVPGGVHPRPFRAKGKIGAVAWWADPRALGLGQGEATMQLAQSIKRETRTQDGRRARIFDDKGKVAPYGVSYLGGLQASHNVNCDMLAVYPQPAHQRDNGLKDICGV